MPDREIRILMGIPHPDAKGGPPTHLPLLVDYFSNHPDYRIRTFFYGSQHFGTERGKRETVAQKTLVTLLKLLEYIYYLVTFRPQIVHLNTAFGKLSILRDFPFAIVSRVFFKKLIFKIHGSHNDLLFTKNRVLRLLVNVFFRGATRVGVLSATERREFIENFGFSEKLVIVKNIFEPTAKEQAEYPIEKEQGVIYGLFISRIDNKKGLDDLLRAIPAILVRIPAFKLIIAGDGPEGEHCQSLAQQLGIYEKTKWIGYIGNKYVSSLLSQCHVFIYPTCYPEGMPMALVEALQAGIPLITTRVRFAESYLEDGENCLFIERRDPEDLASSVISLLSDPELQKSMHDRNPLLAKQFDQQSVGGEFAASYQHMLGN